ncbi:MAG: tetratricopeptide repeat protein [Mariprofundaceae bacterium]
MLKTGYALLLAIAMVLASTSPLVAADLSQKNTAQENTAQKNAPKQINPTKSLQALEHRLSKLESDPHFAFEVQNKFIDRSFAMLKDRLNEGISGTLWRVNLYAGLYALVFIVMGFFGYMNIRKWVKKQIEKQAEKQVNEWLTDEKIAGLVKERGGQAITDAVARLEKQAEREIEEKISKAISGQLSSDEAKGLEEDSAAIENKDEASRTASDWVSQALAAYQSANYPEAFKHAAKAYDMSPSAHSAWIAAESAGESDRIEAAEDYYKKASALDANNADILGNYAVFLTKQGRPGEAEVMYKRAIEADPKHANSLGNYALFLEQQDRPEEAKTMYQRAIKAEPNDADFLGNYALSLEQQDRPDEAEAMYKRAIEADPKHANNLGNYALFLTDVRGKHDEAETLYKRAIEADPKHVNSLGNYALFLEEQGQGEKAAEMRERATKAGWKDE